MDLKNTLGGRTDAGPRGKKGGGGVIRRVDSREEGAAGQSQKALHGDDFLGAPHAMLRGVCGLCLAGALGATLLAFSVTCP